MALLGEWLHYKDDNIDAFFDLIKSPDDVRAKAKEVHPKLVMAKSGDTYTMQIVGPQKTLESSFEVGKEFDHVAGLSDRRRRAIAERLGEGSFQIKGVSGDTPIDRLVETRTLVNGDLVLTLEADGVVAKRYFKRP